jgi:serine/threonine protein kinase
MTKSFKTLHSAEQISIEEKSFAGGGEGNLYHIKYPLSLSKSKIVKLYHPHKLTLSRQEKLRYLILNPPEEYDYSEDPPSIVWINDLIVNENGSIIGFLMPFVKGEKLELLSTLRLPKSVAEDWKRFDFSSSSALNYRMRLCFNIAVSLQKIHSGGKYVLVDLKPDNIIVQKTGVISFVDLDSVEVVMNGESLFDAPVATPEYTAPEHYRSLPYDPTARQAWDNFSVAVIFYKLLFGIHPFAAASKSPYEHCLTLEQKIEAGLYVHNPKFKSYFSVIPPPHKKFEDIDNDLKILFNRTFSDGHFDPESRPNAEEWCLVFLKAINDDKLNAAFGHLTVALQEPINVNRVTAGRLISVPEYNFESAKKIIPDSLNKNYNSNIMPNVAFNAMRPIAYVQMKKANFKRVSWIFIGVCVWNFVSITEYTAGKIKKTLKFLELPHNDGYIIIIMIGLAIVLFWQLNRLSKIIHFFLSKAFISKFKLSQKLKNKYKALKKLSIEIENYLKDFNNFDLRPILIETEEFNKLKTAEILNKIEHYDQKILLLVEQEKVELSAAYRECYANAYRLISGLYPMPVNNLKEILKILRQYKDNKLWEKTALELDNLFKSYRDKFKAIKIKFNEHYDNLIVEAKVSVEKALKEIENKENENKEMLLREANKKIPLDKLESIDIEIFETKMEIEKLEFEKSKYRDIKLKEFLKMK